MPAISFMSSYMARSRCFGVALRSTSCILAFEEMTCRLRSGLKSLLEKASSPDADQRTGLGRIRSEFLCDRSRLFCTPAYSKTGLYADISIPSKPVQRLVSFLVRGLKSLPLLRGYGWIAISPTLARGITSLCKLCCELLFDF